MRSRFHWRLFLAMAAIVIAVAAVLSMLAMRATTMAGSHQSVALAKAQQLWWVGLSVVLVLALGATLLVALRLSAPLADLVRSAEQLAAGGSGSRVVLHTRDETGALAAALNLLRERLSREAESTIRQHDQLNAVLSGMNDGVLAVDATEKILHVNRVALAILGVEAATSEVIGRALVELTRNPHVVVTVTEVLETGAEVNRSFVMRTDSGLERAVEVTANALFSNEDGEMARQPAGAVLVMHDATRIEQLEGVRRDFVSNVSHELKTPLTAIRGFVETMLEADDIDRDTQKKFLSRIKVQTNRLSDLVGDLLSLSRIESEQSDEPPTPVDARIIVGETIRALRPESEARQTALEVSVCETPATVVAEPEHLRQAFSNLVGNALKYSEAGGRVEVRLFERDENVVFEVNDEGPGIAKDHVDRIFERFYRVDKARSRELGGTGLGLAIVKNVAASVSGTVEVDTELGRGSTFRMILPKAGEVGGQLELRVPPRGSQS